jgi:NAD(P)-dependent dehydrogenase (short-subunit alcohol dehydrogenase family)
VIHLTKTVALELGEDGIRVNAICPGFIATPLAAGRPDADDSQISQLREAGAASQVLGRVGEPLDIANMALFLASDESEWITGREFVVDGGFEAGPPWRKWPAFARMERPIRHHRPPGR